MDKAFSLIVIVILVGTMLYFVPIIGQILGVTGDNVGNELSGVIAISFDHGKTFHEGSMQSSYGSVDINDFDYLQAHSLKKPLLLAASSKGLLLSDNDGISWNFFDDLHHELSGVDIRDIAINPYNKREVLIAAHKDGNGVLYRSDNTFFTVEKIFEDEERINAIHAYGDGLYIGTQDGKLIRYNLSNNTFRVLGTFGSPIVSLFGGIYVENLYIITKDRGVFVSSDQGNSLIGLRNKIGERFDAMIKTIAFDEGAHVSYAATALGIIESVDGYNWRNINEGASPLLSINALAVSSGGVFFAGVHDKIYVSRDHGFNWEYSDPFSRKEDELSVIKLLRNDTLVLVGTRN
ncbi:MAG: hypothetical protein A3A04_00400 [Candidatus Harrisonbacteria bacterium RIFCSPLOWO2_01_FULL_40_28]|uniref:Photosynthesis system II assembly factor Ycf48/Hcf136-like domain-containing protein n=1 Tax=Candidatus Harrisonbacteria bacterium RIFCSPLOWO2_01_FULL_40_28 TaxID=1798406 RepID=A0A1G1ZMC6_9BACT|nr:MAG: hypothetical protein A3A04_00400 [Candidatus Harrisonbacteria bacterium RIFCSPLOWO2_01_FULL_40_28]